MEEYKKEFDKLHSETEGLVIRATEDFDDNGTARSAGDRWMIKGKYENISLNSHACEIFDFSNQFLGVKINNLIRNTSSFNFGSNKNVSKAFFELSALQPTKKNEMVLEQPV